MAIPSGPLAGASPICPRLAGTIAPRRSIAPHVPAGGAPGLPWLPHAFSGAVLPSGRVFAGPRLRSLTITPAAVALPRVLAIAVVAIARPVAPGLRAICSRPGTAPCGRPAIEVSVRNLAVPERP
jgi:hypothetical protein